LRESNKAPPDSGYSSPSNAADNEATRAQPSVPLSTPAAYPVKPKTRRYKYDADGLEVEVEPDNRYREESAGSSRRSPRDQAGRRGSADRPPVKTADKMANLAASFSKKPGRPTTSAGYDGARSSDERPSGRRATTDRDYYEQGDRSSRERLFGERRDAYRRGEEAAGYSGSYATGPPPPAHVSASYGYRPTMSSGTHYSSNEGISFGKRYTTDDVNYGSYRSSRDRHEEPRGRPRQTEYDARDRAYPAHGYNTSRPVPV